MLRFSRSDIGHYRRWGSPICRRFLQWTTLVHLALVLIERPERYVGGYLDDIPSALSPAIEAVVLCAYAGDLAAFFYFGGRLSVGGLIDYCGNPLAARKLLTTKLPLVAFLLELATQLEHRQIFC